MASQLREPPQESSAPGTYPQLDPAAIRAINKKLIEIVSLLHQGGISDAQLRELTACVRAQTANIETLHRFSLSNADEPAFIFRDSGDK
ncbi:hypothetical protein SAMN05444161_8238 [Rhizobiales bacterium GAS191]|nr:hypothetical protein SAMN05444161_8238 [Rhizobiales bacterium GAS191]